MLSQKRGCSDPFPAQYLALFRNDLYLDFGIVFFLQEHDQVRSLDFVVYADLTVIQFFSIHENCSALCRPVFDVKSRIVDRGFLAAVYCECYGIIVNQDNIRLIKPV